jgi:hypothetical protein
MRVGGRRHAPVTLPPGKTRYPLYRRLGGPQGRSGRVRKIPPPPGFDPRIIQAVASRYTDWATPAPAYIFCSEIFLNVLPTVLIFQGTWPTAISECSAPSAAKTGFVKQNVQHWGSARPIWERNFKVNKYFINYFLSQQMKHETTCIVTVCTLCSPEKDSRRGMK